MPAGQFPASRYRALRCTVTQQFPQPLFACHQTAEGKEIACAGYLAVEGHGNLTVRLAVATGQLDPAVLQPDPGWPPLFAGYEEMASTQSGPEVPPPTHHRGDPTAMTKTATTPKITTEIVIDAACQQMEADGLADLSMRRIGDLLGIQAASLYWYVPSKEHLLDLMADRLLTGATQSLRRMRLTPDVLTDPRDRLRAAMIDYRAFLFAHRDSAVLLAQRVPFGLRYAEFIGHFLAPFAELGATEAEAAEGALLLLEYVYGSVLHFTTRVATVPDISNRDTSPEGVVSQRDAAAALVVTADICPAMTEATAVALATVTSGGRFRIGCEALIAGLLPPGRR